MKNLYKCVIFYLCFYVLLNTNAFSQTNKKVLYLDLQTQLGYFNLADSPFHIAKVIDHRKDTNIGRTYREHKRICFKNNIAEEFLQYFQKIIPPKIPEQKAITFELLELRISHFYNYRLDAYDVPRIKIKYRISDKNEGLLCEQTTSYTLSDSKEFVQSNTTTVENAPFFLGYASLYQHNNRQYSTQINYQYILQKILQKSMRNFDKIRKKKNMF